MEIGYYKSKENIAHHDDLKERVLKGEVISVTGIEEEYGGTVIKFWRFGNSQQTEIFFSGKEREKVDKYFQKL